MTNEQKQRAQFGVSYAVEHIQEIEDGSDTLHEKKRQVDRQLLLMLDDVILSLPKALREQAQACIDVSSRLQDAVMIETGSILNQLQEKASPSCLQALDSL